MRLFFQFFKLILSTIFIGISLQSSPALADGGEDYFSELRKLDHFDAATISKIRNQTIEKEQINTVNAHARNNTEHNAAIERKKPSKTKSSSSFKSTAETSKSDKPASKKPVAKKPEPALAPSAPVKVDSDTPDELSFPGTGEDENEKGADAKAPALQKKK